jgi:hypothetical protein
MDGLGPSPSAELAVERARPRSIKIYSRRSLSFNAALITPAAAAHNPAVVTHSNQIRQPIFNLPGHTFPRDRSLGGDRCGKPKVLHHLDAFSDFRSKRTVSAVRFPGDNTV